MGNLRPGVSAAALAGSVITSKALRAGNEMLPGPDHAPCDPAPQAMLGIELGARHEASQREKRES